MNHKALSTLLFVVLSSLTAKAQNFQQAYPARPFWYNPGAVSHDTSNVISAQSNFILYTRSFPLNRSRFSDAQITGEISLPGKMGAIGLQYYTLPGAPNYHNRTYSLAYAYGVPIAGGRLGVGAQTNITNRQIPENELRRYNYDTNEWENIQVSNNNKTLLDLSVGAYYNRGKFFAGISGQNLLGSKVNFVSDSGNYSWKTNNISNIRALAGYQFRLTSALQLQTTAMMSYVNFYENFRNLESQFNATAIINSHWQVGFTFFNLDLNSYSALWLNLGYQTKKFEVFVGARVYNNSFSIDPIHLKSGIMLKLPGLKR